LRIGLFFGSTDGNTLRVAELIEQRLTAQNEVQVELLDIADYFLDALLDFDYLILGVPTWNIGQLQQDWDAVFEEFEHLDLTGKTVAVFGLGDQIGYPDTFVDALFFIGNKVQERGAQLVGRWPATGYDFRQSWALDGDQFIGLVVDEHHQAHMTKERIARWVAQVLDEFGRMETG
jgi:flavodoxin I